MPLALDARTSLALARQLCPGLPDDLALARVTGWSRTRVRRWLDWPPLPHPPAPPTMRLVWRDSGLTVPPALPAPRAEGPLSGLLLDPPPG